MNKYAFGDLIPTFNGNSLSGFDEGDDVIQVKRRVAKFSDKVGADGQMTTVRSSNNSGSIMLKFMQGSQGSYVLSQAFDNQVLLGSGFVPGQFSLYNPATRESVIATNCYITKPADMTRGADANGEEWEIVVEDLEMFRTVSSAFSVAVSVTLDGITAVL